MILDKKLIIDYNNNGVVVLRNIVTKYWLKKLAIGIEKNFKSPSKYKCVYEQKRELREHNSFVSPFEKWHNGH